MNPWTETPDDKATGFIGGIAFVVIASLLVKLAIVLA